MISADLTADSQALLMLCSHIGLPKQVEGGLTPLSRAEWSGLAGRLHADGWERPGTLLGRTAGDLIESLELDTDFADRLARLLDRGGQLAIELNRLSSRGIWALTCADDSYPSKLRDRLAARAPVVLFGAGPMAPLSGGGVAIVGSRNLNAAGVQSATTLGQMCAMEGMTVISGGARGADGRAMDAALEADGHAVGIVADSLERSIRSQEAGRHIRRGRLTLATHVHPSAGFGVGNAMARNKIIYGLADEAVVIASSLERGGTWSGATENLDAGWVPLHVLRDPEAPPGNEELIRRGGRPLPSHLLRTRETSLSNLLARPVMERWAEANPPVITSNALSRRGAAPAVRHKSRRAGRGTTMGEQAQLL